MFPGNMKDIPDYRLVYNLLQKSQYGIRFYGEGLFDEMMELVHAFDSSGYTSRLVYLLRMLEKLHDCRNFKLISGTAYSQANHIPDMKEPVNKVYAYLYNHFKEKVTLGEIAEFVNQNPAALCRYFRQRTDKSIFRCLAEIRIEHACRLLVYSDMNISHIAYESGYNSVNHCLQLGECLHCGKGDARYHLPLLQAQVTCRSPVPLPAGLPASAFPLSRFSFRYSSESVTFTSPLPNAAFSSGCVALSIFPSLVKFHEFLS